MVFKNIGDYAMNLMIGLSVIAILLVLLYIVKKRTKLSHIETMFDFVTKHTNDGIVIFEKGKIIYESPSHILIVGRKLMGCTKEDIYPLLHPDDREPIFKRFQNAVNNHETFLRNNYRALHTNGYYIYKEDNIKLEYDRQGELFRTYIMVRDVTKEHETQDKIAESEERYRTFVELSSDMIFLKDKVFRYLIVNYNIATFMGKNVEEVVGKNDFELMPYQEAQQCRKSDMQALELNKTIVSQEQVNGRIYETTKYPLLFKGEMCIAGVIRDITDKTHAKEEIYQLAFYDPLTNLPNRRLFLDRLSHALKNAQHSILFGGIIKINVDHFKIINDTWGYTKGDLLLQTIAARLGAVIEPQDTLARFSGDEFILLCEDYGRESTETEEKIVDKTEQIRTILHLPYLLEGAEYLCTVSIGATLLKPDSQNMLNIVKEVEIALHQAKEDGRNCVRFFEQSMQEKVSLQFVLEGALRKGLENKSFELYYQSQVDASMHVTGAEALLRWHHEGKLISPLDFIPILERSGLIVDVGLWVIEEGCRTLEKWSHDTRKLDLTLALNISPKQFEDVAFISKLHSILAQCSFHPSRLKLELTENLFLKNTQMNIEKMGMIRKMGIGLSLDDFGTGYASLSYLKRIPITQLKIDQSFVRGVLDDENDAMIIKMIIGVAHHLGVSLIAEGVETRAQMQWLHDNQCESFQGYYIDKPQTLAMFEKKWELLNG